jgi:hypothetical protein
MPIERSTTSDCRLPIPIGPEPDSAATATRWRDARADESHVLVEAA